MSKWMPADDPLSETDEDTLDRTEHARIAAQVISSAFTWDSSSVFGVVGPWGSGKSSLLTLIKTALEPPEGVDDWIVIDYTPWSTSDPSALLEEFFTSLNAALPPRTGEKAKRAIGRLAQIVSPAASGLPLVGGALAAGGSAIGEKLLSRPPWDEAFERAAEYLREHGHPILIVIDDVDRLHAAELSMLLKVVRLLGRFPGVMYLLAYDENSIFAALESGGGPLSIPGGGQRFMEKIVQYRFATPPLTPSQFADLMNQGVQRATEVSARDFEAERLDEVVTIARRHLTTPRAVHQFTAHLAWAMAALPRDECDDRDLFATTLLRVCFPALHNELPRWRSELLSGSNGKASYAAHSVHYEDADFSDLLAKVETPTRQDALSLLKLLFPRIGSPNSPTGEGFGRRRISSQSYFDRYFSLAITKHDISDVAAAKAVQSAMAGDDEPLSSLLAADSGVSSELALERIRSVEIPATDIAGVTALALTALRLASGMKRGPWVSSVRSGLLHWAETLIQGFLLDDIPHLIKEVADLPLQFRAELWRDVFEDLNRRSRSETPPALTQEMERLAHAAAESVLEHIRQRDGAPYESGHGFLRVFALRYGARDLLRRQIQSGISGGDFTLADVAARFVGVGSWGGRTRELDEFDRDAFREVIGKFEDPWLDSTIIDGLDKSDMGWANRRLFAQGRAR